MTLLRSNPNDSQSAGLGNGNKAGILPCNLLQDILGQAPSLEAVVERQFGPGRAALAAAAELAARADHIVLSGMGSSLFASGPLHYYLNSRGVPATIVEASELLHYQPRICRPGSVVVLVSRSGETVEAVKLLPLLKERGVPVIGVTNAPQNTLSREATQSIDLGSFPDELVAVQTYGATVATLLLLGATITGELQERWRKELVSLVRVLAGFIPACLDHSAQWNDFLESSGPLYLLGRGPSLSSVAEGVLLFHEIAKAPVVGMSAGHFRHGPVEVVSDEFKAIVFATQEATQSLDVLLADDLAGVGARIHLVGTSDHGLVSELCAWPAEVPELWAPLVEIIPIQVAALRLAQARGMKPGVFRFAFPVTLSESGFKAVPVAEDRECE